MKNFFALMILFSAFANTAQAASNVNVVIDDQAYNCSQGGTGNQCECVIYTSYSTFYRRSFKKGNFVKSDDQKFGTQAEAERDCVADNKTNTACY